MRLTFVFGYWVSFELRSRLTSWRLMRRINIDQRRLNGKNRIYHASCSDLVYSSIYRYPGDNELLTLRHHFPQRVLLSNSNSSPIYVHCWPSLQVDANQANSSYHHVMSRGYDKEMPSFPNAKMDPLLPTVRDLKIKYSRQMKFPAMPLPFQLFQHRELME
jgi:hypothetical protein